MVRVADDFTGKIYIELNVHVVSESDFEYVRSRIRQVLGRDVQVTQLSSTELLLEPLSERELTELNTLKFIERIGRIEAQYDTSRLPELINYLKMQNLKPVTKIRDFSLRWRIVQVFGKPKNFDENTVLLRDFEFDHGKIILIIRPVNIENFRDLADMFYDSYTGSIMFAVCDVSSEHEIVSCVRICCALKVRLFLISPHAKFSDRKLHEEFKKFYGLCKARTFTDLKECVEWVKRHHRDVNIVGLSMHAHRGEKTLEDYIRRCSSSSNFLFVLGGETWGLTPSQVELCDIVVRLGPSTGVPMSISEVIAYTTCLVRKVLSTRSHNS